MCVGGQAGFNARQARAGQAVQRSTQTSSTKSIFNPGKFRVTTEPGVQKTVRLNSLDDYNQQRDALMASIDPNARTLGGGGPQQVAESRIRRKNGPTFKNRVTPDPVARTAVADEGSTRRKTRSVRAGMQEEANARSRSTRKKGRGLRIGGSGVSVPGSTGVQ